MTGVPVQPPPSPWDFPPASAWPEDDLVAAGADLEPGTLLAAYRRGLFPMPGPDGAEEEPPYWFSPQCRGVLPLEPGPGEPGGLRVPRSLRKAVGRFEIRIDTAFREVMIACADPAREGSWIEPAYIAAYTRLHDLRWAHSVETWREGRLVGGLYGVGIGGLFAGESMFHHETDASKVALVALVERLRAAGPSGRLLDVQWQTSHLASLGVVEIEREVYLERLARAVCLPDAWT